MAKAIHLGPYHGALYEPDYQLHFYRDGDPKQPVSTARLDHRSVVAIQTSKSLTDVAGTFSITLKDKRARGTLREMDTVRIRLRGHHSNQLVTVMKGVIDTVRPAGSADTHGSREDTVVEGRCVGKYTQVNSLFLPVWDADGNLPTALTFGLGDVTQKGTPTYKAGGTSPYSIFNYIAENYVFGGKNVVGTGGIPNARHWLDVRSRFARNVGMNIPFLQFNEDPVSSALKAMEVVGFTEAWVDELGRVVYRHPQWDSPVRYVLSTGDLMAWEFPRSDLNTATYVEVIPAGDPGVDSGIAQALRAGRAPVPSSYVKAGGKSTELGKYVSPEYVIETDRKGKPTAAGRANVWYQRQRRLGTRPQQVTSPLLVTQAQAQAQAEGLLRFYSRMDKGMSLTIPGTPELRLGFMLRCHGELEGLTFDRSGYTEQVSHNYVESPGGGEYTTQVTCTHGRDARDPFTGRPDAKWGKIALPKYDAADLATNSDGGVLEPSSDPSADSETNGETGGGDAVDARGVHASKTVSRRLTHWTASGSDVWICSWMIPQLNFALSTNLWSGKITEGWRSVATQQVYWDKYGHDTGRAAPPGQSNHGFTVYPKGAIDTADPAGLERALRKWRSGADTNAGPTHNRIFAHPDRPNALANGGGAQDGAYRPAMIGNGKALPRDVVHFSSNGH